MNLKTTPFDVADTLDSYEVIKAYLAEAFATGDPKLITAAQNDVSRAKGMRKSAENSSTS